MRVPDRLFVNIVAPPSFPGSGNFPVKVYIHGGYVLASSYGAADSTFPMIVHAYTHLCAHRFLQFGSPHGLSGSAQYIAAERNEVWVNIGYRLSAFGFLASDEPRVDGNFGFKDQWIAMEWVKENIGAFGGALHLVVRAGIVLTRRRRESGRRAYNRSLGRIVEPESRPHPR